MKGICGTSERWKDACLQANGIAQATRLQELKQNENRNLQELNIKERALAETAALLVLRKTRFGGRRDADQRLRSQDSNGADRSNNKDREKMACQELGISQRTLQRWRRRDLQDQRQVVPPLNKLTNEMQYYRSELGSIKSSPSQIVPRLQTR